MASEPPPPLFNGRPGTPREARCCFCRLICTLGYKVLACVIFDDDLSLLSIMARVGAMAFGVCAMSGTLEGWVSTKFHPVTHAYTICRIP